MKKQPTAADFAGTVDMFKFSELSTQVCQPIDTAIQIEHHNVKTFQGWFLTSPCGLDVDLGVCYLHNYPVRESLYFWAIDLEDGRKVKLMKLPKIGARAYLTLIEKEKLEPTTTAFRITREKVGTSYRYTAQVEAKSLSPYDDEAPEDLVSMLLNWASPDVQRRHVPNFSHLRPKWDQEGDDEHYVVIDNPEI